MSEINFNEVTLEDCIEGFELRGMITVIENGKVVEISKNVK